MRNNDQDDHDDLDLSQHRASRLPVILAIVGVLGVAVAAAWVFTPILLSKDQAATAGLFSKTKPQQQPAAPVLASAQPAPPAAAPQPDTTASKDDQTATAALGPTVASASASTPWPQGIQVATAPAANADTTQAATAAPDDPPAEPFDNVPLPRKRPSRLIAASLAIPLPRPRPEIEPEAPAGPTAFDLQVERMR